VAAGVVLAGLLFRRTRVWGRTKTVDKGLGTEIAVGLVLIPGLLLLAAGIVVGPMLPAAATAGIEPPNWLGEYHWAKPAFIMMMLWAAIGSNNMILYLAGLSSIPPELYEAADMDGATAGQRFWYITWPQLAPVTFFIGIMSVIYGLQGGFEMARAMTLGGPAGSTTTLSYYIFNQGFETGRIGYASAMAWVLFALVFVLSLCNFRYGNRNADD
jgi:multiple sugar transport system permease protein